jgi:hypothetical protein
VSVTVAFKDWQDCIRDAAPRLDDYSSSVMDIASAVQPVCIAKEDVMIDAMNKEYLEKNAGVAANMTLAEMIRVRQSTHTSMTQTIGTLILTLRKDRKKSATTKS